MEKCLVAEVHFMATIPLNVIGNKRDYAKKTMKYAIEKMMKNADLDKCIKFSEKEV